jgi:hypothetical protein
LTISESDVWLQIYELSKATLDVGSLAQLLVLLVKVGIPVVRSAAVDSMAQELPLWRPGGPWVGPFQAHLNGEEFFILEVILPFLVFKFDNNFA